MTPEPALILFSLNLVTHNWWCTRSNECLVVWRPWFKPRLVERSLSFISPKRTLYLDPKRINMSDHHPQKIKCSQMKLSAAYGTFQLAKLAITSTWTTRCLKIGLTKTRPTGPCGFRVRCQPFNAENLLLNSIWLPSPKHSSYCLPSFNGKGDNHSLCDVTNKQLKQHQTALASRWWLHRHCWQLLLSQCIELWCSRYCSAWTSLPHTITIPNVRVILAHS